MSWQDFADKDKKEEKAKDAIFNSTGAGHFYCVIRVGRKFKTIGQISQFAAHTERKKNTPNANPNIQNQIIIGSANLNEDIKNYVKDCKYIPANAVLAREMLLTASPGFFKNMPKHEFDRWVELNKNWLLKEFGDNIRYCSLHLDESTPHFHILLVPKVKNVKGEYILSNWRYFGSKELMRGWQDKYSIEMQNTFKSLNRGIKYSKAKHIEIRHFYSMVNAQLDEKDLQQLCAKAKNGDLLHIKLKAIQDTLKTYKDYSDKTYEEKQQLLESNKDLKKNLKELKADNEIFHEALEILSQQHKLPQNAIKQALKYATNSLDRER